MVGLKNIVNFHTIMLSMQQDERLSQKIK